MNAARSRDIEIIEIEAALRRAAAEARRIAALTHTPLVLFRNGRIVREMVQETRGRRRAAGSAVNR